MIRRLGFVGPALLAAATAHAEPTPSDRAAATQLFKEGRALMDRKKYLDACPKLEESQRLDPGGGTLLNLALCHEAIGRTATAWAELSEALSVARRDRRPDREKLASERMKALEPKLSRLTLTVGAGAAVAGLVVKRDGTEVGQAAWGAAMPVDPGTHQLEASAPGYATWSSSVEVGADADQRVIEIPVLAALPPATPETPPPEPAPAPTPSPAPAAPPPALPPPAPQPEPSLLPAYVAFGVGIVGVTAGSYFGLSAISKRKDSDAECAPKCSDRAVELNDQAKTAADLSTISFALGVAGLGLGTYLWLETPSSSARSGSLTVRGRF